MTVGLPGTGIGGLYYFVLVLLMPFREACLTLRGRSSVERWKQVGGYWCILLAILGVLWAESWLLEQFVTWSKSMPLLASTIGHAEAAQSVMLRVGQFAAAGSILTLSAIVAFAWMLHVAIRLGLIKRQDRRAEVLAVNEPSNSQRPR
ncbi:MAG: hypothetical protein L0Y44_06520 [Phycisphaerales bacterium]|nr:hypothetical protein [Phycisphaerales bacterium]MCI0630294.1 hypothetical protein [Phycisphaerales bacterium]MCI0675801.1 hypothetical protein [Phycisphaerales bacterium]